MNPNRQSPLSAFHWFILAVCILMVLSSMPVVSTDANNPSEVDMLKSGADISADHSVDPLIDTPHQVRVIINYSVDSASTDFEVSIHNSSVSGHDVRIQSVNGFDVSREGNVQLSYTGETESPSVTYTVNKSKHLIGSGAIRSIVSGEDWVVFRNIGITSVEYSGAAVNSSLHIQTNRPLIQANNYTYVGNHTLYEHQGAKQNFTMIVPDAASMTADPRAVLKLADNTTKLLSRDPGWNHSYIFVTPNDPIDETTSSSNAFGPDMAVDASAKISKGIDGGQGAQSLWMHELGHVYHPYSADRPPRMRWMAEASATYIGAYASYMEGLVSFGHFYNWTVYGYSGEEEQLHDDVLANESTWDGPTSRSKGRRVLIALDAEIRQETGGNRTLFDVFYLLDKTPNGLNIPEFKQAVEQTANTSLDDWIDTYINTTAAPTAPKNESLYDSIPNSSVEAPEFNRTDGESENVTANVTYQIDPLPDQPHQIHVRVNGTANHLSDLKIFIENKSENGFRTNITRTTGVRNEEFSNIFHLFPEGDASSFEAVYRMNRTPSYPTSDYSEYSQNFTNGISYGVRDSKNLTVVEDVQFVNTSDSDPTCISDAVSGEDNAISISEIQTAINWWAEGTEVPDTDGKTISLTKIQSLINAWAEDTPVTC